MTQIQVDYQKLQETKRHNEEMEKIGQVSNVIANEQAAAQWKAVNSKAWNDAFKTAFSGLDSLSKAGERSSNALFGSAKGIKDLASAVQIMTTLFA